MSELRFTINGTPVTVNDAPANTTLLNFLRQHPDLKGTKEGCAEGDCGACTVAVLDTKASSGPTWRAVNSCLLLLPMLHGKQIVTVEGLAQDGKLHPTQQQLVEHLGSQCGYCTPGVIMSMFEACYRSDMNAPWKIDDQMCGNLCRCTGYRPIRNATSAIAGLQPDDSFSKALTSQASDEASTTESLAYEGNGQRFYAPTDFGEVFDLMDAHPGHRFIGGSTDLGLDVTKKHTRFPCLISLDRIPGMRAVERTDDGWLIGGNIRLSDLEQQAHSFCSPIARMLRYFGARQIKNSATLAGNLCNASPIGDMPPIFIALGASVTLRSRTGLRHVPLDEFFVSYRKTALQPGEFLEAVELPRLRTDARVGAYKVSKRRELDISAVAAGMFVLLDAEGCVSQVRLAYGGMAATPLRASKTEAALLGQPWTQQSIEAATAKLDEDFTPLSDQRASAWYRMKVAKNFLRGFYIETQKNPVRTLPEGHSGTIVLESQR